MNNHIPSPGDPGPATGDDGNECYIDLNVEWVTDTVVP